MASQPAPIALKQSATASGLLTGWSAQGWSVVRRGVTRSIPIYGATGDPMIPLQIDAFEWIDVSFMGIGNADDAIAKLRSYIQSGGSDLYAYALFTKTDFNFLGVREVRYRLVLVHSIVQLIGAAILILAIAFAAIIFIQYVTTGQSPAVNDLKSHWGSAVTSVGDAAGKPIQAAATTYIWATVAAGAGILLLSVASKDLGVKTPKTPSGPKGSFGVNTGVVRGSVSS